MYEKFGQKIGAELSESLRNRYGVDWISACEASLENQRDAIFQQDERQLEKASQTFAWEQFVSMGWHRDILPHLPVIFGFLGEFSSVENCLPYATAQLGWDYHFSKSAEQLITEFRNSSIGPKLDDDMIDFVVGLLNQDIENNENLKALKER